ncbi:hypothetical protein [Amycolatopsis sp. NPDC054798]
MPRLSARTAAACAAALTASCLVTATVAMLAGPALAFTATGALLAVGVWSGRRRTRTRPQPAVRCRKPAGKKPAEEIRACPVPVDSLPLDQLCLLWRRSFVQLQRAADERARHAVVAARQAYLDELERRDRPGFARWLDSGARAAGDPSRYVRPVE